MRLALIVVYAGLLMTNPVAAPSEPAYLEERQITRGSGGRILTNTGVWSPDGHWIIYDTRSGASGDIFDGVHIEMVHVETGEVRRVFSSANGACCGVVTFHPVAPKAVFILGPEHPDSEWSYNAYHRQGCFVTVDLDPVISRLRDSEEKQRALNLDARDLAPPFTAGALRGGTHVHVWDAAGQWVSFTYEDHVLAVLEDTVEDRDFNQRNIGICIPDRPVRVGQAHTRNHNGQYFSVLVTRTRAHPKPGSDEISRACEEGWIGTNGYLRADGTRQHRALAFQGVVMARNQKPVTEVYLVDIPDDPTIAGDGPLAGSERRMPYPPKGCLQRRLTHTEDRRYPGIQGPRHWLRSAPDGRSIAFLMKDDQGIAQLWTINPLGGSPRQVTRNAWPIASAFTWHPSGRQIAHVMDRSVCVTEVVRGETRRLTLPGPPELAPRPEACIFSPDGKAIAYVRQAASGSRLYNQIFVVKVEP